MSEDLKELEGRIKQLEDLLEEKDEKIDDLKSDIKDLEYYRDNDEGCDCDDDLSNYSDKDIMQEFMDRNGTRMSLMNDMKMEKIIQNFDKFSLEQFEEFLKSIAKPDNIL